MAEQKKQKSSRRAQRRAREEQELKRSKAKKRAEEAEDESSEDEDSEDADDDAEAEDEADSEDEASTAASDDADEAEDSEDEAEDIRQIRDRNKRLRAKAAAKRRQRRRRQEAAQAVGLDATEMVDDVLARSSAKAGRFVKQNFRVLQWVIVVGLVGTVSWYIYSYVHKQDEAQATDALMEGIRAENGVTRDQGAELPEEMGVQTFNDHTERLKAAEEAYRTALKEAAEPAGQTLAHMGLAGVLFDQGKYDDAKSEYDTVLGSELAKVDLDVQARATEGAALAIEAKGDKKAAGELYKKLEGIEGYKPLGQYHQARLALESGDKEGAKKLLLEVNEKLRDDKFARQGFVYGMSLQMLATVDPKAAEEAQKQVQESPEEMLKKLQEMEERLKNMQGGAGDLLKKLGIGPDGKPLAPASGAPAPAPAPAPSGGE